ncbi:hypothetical protein [Streptomyces sp. NRRL F-2799]|uniref:hypothetical protein n=1 Tax=Streptomyces sp. NRRL F-2799 TaxID=1463844 RepID=UPI000691B13D|nr:hypothetical protein [Streptomyces sp. NRRL F-2799]
MTFPGGTTVNDPLSAVHTGSGHQFNFNWMTGADEHLIRKGVPRVTIVREHRRRLAQCFVPPRRYGLASKMLDRSGAVVILDGPPGAGRRAAATMLLDEVSGDTGLIDELPPTSEEAAFEPQADHRYLLDLSSTADDDFLTAQHTLVRYRSAVAECGARLVIVLPAGLDWLLQADLAPLVVRLDRPNGRSVFVRNLRARRVDFTQEQLDTAELRHMYDAAPMRELARLADLVTQARDSRRFGPAFPTWRDEALAAATNWSDQVARQLGAHRDAPGRAMLFAAAMLSGAAADAAHSGAHRLLDILRHERQNSFGLARSDLAEELERLSIERIADGRIAFRRLAYDSALRAHFWANFPELRSAFRDWTAQCLDLPELTAGDRRALTARFAEQAFATGRPGDVSTLVEEWTRGPGGRSRAEAAAALELGLSHERYGSYFRAQIYTWVTGRVTADLSLVLTDVCRQVMAGTHPEQAAVRLRHLALRQEGPHVTTARSALVDLAWENPRIFRRLVDRLATDAPARGAGDLLLELLDPGHRSTEPPWPAFTLAWRALLMSKPAAAWTPALRRRLDTLTPCPGGGRVISALVLAAAGDHVLLNRLYVAVCAWSLLPSAKVLAEPGDDTRRRIAQRFCQEIDRALGLDVSSSSPGARDRGENI